MYRSERIPYGNEADDRVTLQHKTDIIDVIVTFELSAPFISSSKTDFLQFSPFVTSDFGFISNSL